MQVQTATFPALGFDTTTILNAQSASALRSAGLSFCLRYLGSVTAQELIEILGAGLSFMPVTFSRAPGWSPTPGLGTQDGQTDAQHLTSAGIPKGCTVWIDLEGLNSAATVSDVAAWVNERAAVINAAGYDAGLYVGANDTLDGPQLYSLANINRYWKSQSAAPEPTCGWAMIQLYKTVVIAGVSVDVDVIQYDYQSRLPSVVSL